MMFGNPAYDRRREIIAKSTGLINTKWCDVCESFATTVLIQGQGVNGNCGCIVEICVPCMKKQGYEFEVNYL